MNLEDPVVQAERQQALKRTAQRAVSALDERRAAKRLLDLGYSQREIAEVLMTSQAKVHRMLKFIELKGGALPVEPEEIILRANAGEISRREIMEWLRAFEYSPGTDAPYPHEGHVDGTWDQVTGAYARGLITKEEFTEVEATRG